MSQENSLYQIAQDLQNKKRSSVEVTTHYLKRMQKHNASINAYIHIDEEAALEAAKKADQIIARGPSHPLCGVPIAQKDIFCTKHIPTTCGSKMLADFKPPYNATVIEKCQEANMVMLGKTNMDEFAMGSSNETSYFGSVKNPYALDYIPGGSSGGSAAAVAAQMAPIATGTDTGGSIRQPCAHTNLTGIKPSYGRISRYGMIAFASSLDQAGVMGQNAQDCALLLDTLTGHDPKDSTSLPKAATTTQAHLEDSIKDLCIGVPYDLIDQCKSPEIQKRAEDTIAQFKKLGATIKPIDLAANHYALPAYYIIASSECSANLSRYDGIRFGHRSSQQENLEMLISHSRSEGFGEEVKRRILMGTFALSSGYFDAYYLKAQKVRRLIAQSYNQAFDAVDLIFCPTTPTPAFKLGEKCDDPISMYLSDIYTLGVNLAGLPAMSFPVAPIGPLPVGMQLIGPHFSEARLLNAVHQFQQAHSYHLFQAPLEDKAS